MGKETSIQWCDVTWNVARGCTKVDADCDNCYMFRLAAAKRLVNLQLQAYRDTHTVLDLRDGEPIIYPLGSALIFVRVTEKAVSLERYRANII